MKRYRAVYENRNNKGLFAKFKRMRHALSSLGFGSQIMEDKKGRSDYVLKLFKAERHPEHPWKLKTYTATVDITNKNTDQINREFNNNKKPLK